MNPNFFPSDGLTFQFDLKTYLKKQNERINHSLDQLLPDSQQRIVQAMRYSLTAGGKRVRPVLCMASANAVGGNDEDVLFAASAIEMIHTYSLIHDDLPAMDNDDLRRGKPTCHVAFDHATAILAGDGLLTLAFQVLSEHFFSLAPSEFENEKKTLQSIKVIQLISKAAGYRGMIEGQMRDMAFEGKEIHIEELEALHKFKTGALIEASVLSGAILCSASNDQIEQLRIYAKNIGLAFQVADDILNIEGDPAVLGKAVGTDLKRKKNTYPSILGLEKSKEFAKKLVMDALVSLKSFDAKADPLRAIASYIIERKK